MSLNFEKKTLDARILEVLKEGNGFSEDDLGTYFYKDVIKGIVYSLDDYCSEAEQRKTNISMIDDISTLVKELELDGSTISSKEDLYALIDREKENKQLRLRYELQNPHSMFYYKVANNFANTNLETFHKHIKDAASKTGLKNTYMAVAYHLGLYVFNLPQENEILDDKEELKATGPKRILTKPE